MPLSGGQQDAIALLVGVADMDDLDEMMQSAHGNAVILSSQARAQNFRLSPEDEQRLNESVEIIVRIQGRFLGKGALWRAMRRPKVAKHYLKGATGLPPM
jgi:hypothetical protein